MNSESENDFSKPEDGQANLMQSASPNLAELPDALHKKRTKKAGRHCNAPKKSNVIPLFPAAVRRKHQRQRKYSKMINERECAKLLKAKTFCDRLIASRNFRGFTWGEAAEHTLVQIDEDVWCCALRPNSIRMYETGELAPSFANIEHLAKAYQVSPGWLAFGSGSP